jgi:ferredoxin-thioredoxin reductase catalytic subunit
VELARITTDKWFDAVTVRVRATSIDYVVSDDGDLVSGSRTKQRKYTEYWTLIRSVARKGAAGEAMVCPSCGGDLDINMAGHCAHCAVKVTTGEFDWVLSRIEQDEVYRG